MPFSDYSSSRIVRELARVEVDLDGDNYMPNRGDDQAACHSEEPSSAPVARGKQLWNEHTLVSMGQREGPCQWLADYRTRFVTTER